MDRRRFLPTYHYVDNTSGNLTKSIGKPLRDYKIYGESVQNGTPTPESPVEIEFVGDKTINLSPINTIRKQSTSRWSYMNLGKLELAPGKYTVKCHYKQYGTPTKAQISVRDYDELNTAYGYSVYHGLVEDDALVSFTLPTTANGIQILLYINATADAIDADCEFTNIMLVEGAYTAETVPEYEPFGYKVPIKVIRKNLFDISQIESVSLLNDGKITNNQDGSLTIEGTYTVNCQKTLSQLAPELKVGDTVVLNAETNAFRYGHGTLNIVYLADGTTVVFGKPITITQSNLDAKVIFYSRMMSSDTTDIEPSYYKNIQLEYGTEATTYEPYVEPQTHNIYLAEPLRKAGDVADYIDFSNKCVVRNVRCLSLDGSDDEVIILQSTNSYGISNFYLNGLSDMALSEDCVMCNRLSRQTTNVANTMTEGFRFVITTSTYPYMRISSERVSTVADFRAWLSDNVVSFAYATNAPIIEPLELPPIPTAKGTVNIMVDTDIKPSGAVWQYYRK